MAARARRGSTCKRRQRVWSRALRRKVWRCAEYTSPRKGSYKRRGKRARSSSQYRRAGKRSSSKRKSSSKKCLLWGTNKLGRRTCVARSAAGLKRARDGKSKARPGVFGPMREKYSAWGGKQVWNPITTNRAAPSVSQSVRAAYERSMGRKPSGYPAWG